MLCRGFESILHSKRQEEEIDQEMCGDHLVSMDEGEAMEQGEKAHEAEQQHIKYMVELVNLCIECCSMSEAG